MRGGWGGGARDGLVPSIGVYPWTMRWFHFVDKAQWSMQSRKTWPFTRVAMVHLKHCPSLMRQFTLQRFCSRLCILLVLSLRAAG